MFCKINGKQIPNTNMLKNTIFRYLYELLQLKLHAWDETPILLSFSCVVSFHIAKEIIVFKIQNLKKSY